MRILKTFLSCGLGGASVALPLSVFAALAGDASFWACLGWFCGAGYAVGLVLAFSEVVS
jgi:hypothetical protein